VAEETLDRSEPNLPQLSRADKVVCALALSAWCVVFNIGNTVGAKPLFDALNSGNIQLIPWLGNFLAIAVIYSPTNVLILSFTAGLAGAVFGRLEDPVRSSGNEMLNGDHRWWKAILGSFMVYLVVLSGVLAIFGMPFKLPDLSDEQNVQMAQGHYRVTASLCSLFALIEGSRPFMLNGIGGQLQRLLVRRGMEGPDGQGKAGG